ncbi:MAG: hypothetical protein ACTHZ1_06140 [Sphingobacterium sp.]
MNLNCLPLYSQTGLSSHIQLPKFEGETVREVFDVLRKEQSVLFSYNSNLLDLDKEVHTDRYKGLLINYLEKLLGEKYSFKETNSHIIITYAPKRMDISTVDIDTTKNNRTMISGYVKDIRTNKPISFVTVYDRGRFRASTLTEKSGYFELDVKHPENSFTIALSKDNYRDTMLVLLLPIELSNEERKIGYYPTSDSSKTISNSALGRFFTSSRQRLQNLNLRGFFVYSPFQISMTPGLSTHGFFNSQVVNKFSLNIIGGYTAGVTGMELAAGFNVNQFDMHGVQFAGLSNMVGGNIKGFQAAGIGNVGLNKLSGIQVAGIWNSADTIESGAQLTGGISRATTVHGGQVAGLMNITKDQASIQLAGGINKAKKVNGTQVAGFMNIATDEAFIQVAGGVNIAKKVHGVQLAVVNIADSSDYPIGVFNWIRTGSRQLSLGVDESEFVALNFKSGGRVMYSILGLGTYLTDANLQYGIEVGIGAHLMKGTRFTLSTELGNRIHFDKDFKHNEAHRSTLRIIPAVNIGSHLQVYAAPSLTYSQAIHPEPGVKGTTWKFWGADPKRDTFHGGGSVGLTYIF